MSECPPCVFGLVGDYIYPGCEYECKLFLDVLTTCSATLYISYMLCVFLYFFFLVHPAGEVQTFPRRYGVN